MKRWLLGALLLVVGFTSCSSGPGGTAGFGGLQGERVTLEKARRSVSYPVRIPRVRPPSQGGIEAVALFGYGPKRQVGIQWEDDTVMSFVPVDFATDYHRTVELVGAGEVITVRGVEAYAREPMDTERQGQLGGFLRWYEPDLELEMTIVGRHPVEDLVRMAESMSS